MQMEFCLGSIIQMENGQCYVRCQCYLETDGTMKLASVPMRQGCIDSDDSHKPKKPAYNIAWRKGIHLFSTAITGQADNFSYMHPENRITGFSGNQSR